MAIYDLAVIGLGLIGSAALRHLSLDFPNLRLCGIGPDEPPDRKTHQGVFASHYDQGRITRVLDPSQLWGELAWESIARYSDIEAASGLQFHHRVGCLRATDIEERIAEVDVCARTYSPPHQQLDAAGCKHVYPFLSFSDDFVAWDEKGEAGYINPRSLIAAQLKVAADHGADIIREIVSLIDDCGDDCLTIRTREGGVLQARKLLLAVGGYSNTLLDRKLDLATKGHTILLAEVPPEEIGRLRAMPSIISSFEDPSVASLYMLPPLPYPDGKTYIKLGPSGYPEPYFNAVDNDSELLDWFHSDGREDIAEAMKAALHRMVPDLKVLSYHSVPCLITNSAHDNPYIDALEDGRIYLATAGNGYAAKSSDEIGRIGAMLCATDAWHSGLNREDFRAVYADGGLK
ncbi:MAG: FAD-dependent oxidoreductase [Chloroflexi bacterium]|nr:FAD-dependent oxidoreductase [Chloroflexota bacterium]